MGNGHVLFRYFIRSGFILFCLLKKMVWLATGVKTMQLHLLYNIYFIINIWDKPVSKISGLPLGENRTYDSPNHAS